MKTSERRLVAREGLVLGWTLDVYARAEGTKHSRERTFGRYLILEGEFTEPLKGVSRFSLQVMVEAKPGTGNREMPCVGAILGLKPAIQAAGTLSMEEFDTVVSLAVAGRLRSISMSFQQPRYGKGLIGSFSFSSREPEATN